MSRIVWIKIIMKCTMIICLVLAGLLTATFPEPVYENTFCKLINYVYVVISVLKKRFIFIMIN